MPNSVCRLGTLWLAAPGGHFIFARHGEPIPILSRPMYKFASAVMLWPVVAQPVLGSQTGCTFSAGDTPDYYEIEFIGYSDTKPVLVFSATTFGAGKRIALRPADYTLHHFSQKDGLSGLSFGTHRTLRCRHPLRLQALAIMLGSRSDRPVFVGI